MVETKLYKTRICMLYQKGRCPRQTCHFAHGHAELRRFSDNDNEWLWWRDYRDNESRDKFVRRRSPPRRFSPRRDSRGRHSSPGYNSPKHNWKQSDDTHKRKHQLDGQNDYFERFDTSDETEGQVKAKKPKHFDSKDDKLREMQSEIDMLDDRKYQLEMVLEERVQEADSLNSRIKELEVQLRSGKEECKRISSKIKKFIRAHNRHSRLQDELKRSEARLHKLGEKIYADAIRPGPTEEDASVSILSDVETFEKYISKPHKAIENNTSPIKKRLMDEENEESKQVNLNGGERFTSRSARLEKFSKRGKDVSANVLRSDKLNGSKAGFSLPSTSIAAQALDEAIEDTRLEEEKYENAGSFAKVSEKQGDASEKERYPLPLPPPPPLPPALRAYLQQDEGDNENVDVDGIDEEAIDEEAIDVDIV